MIPMGQIIQWRTIAPWPDNMQVEQDLILSRIIVEIFSDPFLQNELAFRGGTALHKLFFSPAARYSEDIDLVRTSKGPISLVANTLRKKLEPWLGKAKTESTSHSFKLKFYFNPENSAAIRLRIKIEINIKECFSILKREFKKFDVQSQWFSGNAWIHTFHFNELIGTKLRALYQRNKGRDLFDLWLALKNNNFNGTEVVKIFLEYMNKSALTITKDSFEKNIALKLKEQSFIDDIGILLSPHFFNTDSKFINNEYSLVTEKWNLYKAAEEVKHKILMHLPK
ncbi:MAG: nucleotidyl transferase AbiEii/AbiGii toxin family protein [Gammaproteobacteria bacterium]|nr:nucleotidyl transferase AbiEii/AbiGii toxin family protein [Gammaproteobacteria bacterium]